MTKVQIERIARKLWERATEGDGYQMFGYDERTMWLTKPDFMRDLQRLRKMWNEAKD